MSLIIYFSFEVNETAVFMLIKLSTSISYFIIYFSEAYPCCSKNPDYIAVQSHSVLCKSAELLPTISSKFLELYSSSTTVVEFMKNRSIDRLVTNFTTFSVFIQGKEFLLFFIYLNI